MGPQYSGSYTTYDTEANILASPGRPGDVCFALDTKMRYQCTAVNSWFPTDSLRVIRGTGSINALTTNNNTTILTMPHTTFRFIVLGAHIEVLTLTGAVVTQPTISIGTNAASYNNIASGNILSSLLNAVGLTSTNALTLANAIPALTGDTVVTARIGSLGASVGPTAYTLRVDLMGYYEL